MAHKETVEFYDDEEREKYEDAYRPWRNPLKPFVIALTVLLVLAAAIIALLYLRMQDTEKVNKELQYRVTAAETERDQARSELESKKIAEQQEIAAATSTPEPTPEPTSTPEPTPEPTAVPSPTPVPPLKDTIDPSLLSKIEKPKDESWLEAPHSATMFYAAGATSGYMIAVHSGPGLEYIDFLIVHHGDEVEALAFQNGWYLIRTAEGQYGWVAFQLIKVGDVVTATPTPSPAPSETPLSTAEAAAPDVLPTGGTIPVPNSPTDLG